MKNDGRERFVVAEKAEVIGGLNLLAGGSFDEMIDLADSLDPRYKRGLVVMTLSEAERLREEAVGVKLYD